MTGEDEFNNEATPKDTATSESTELPNIEAVASDSAESGADASFKATFAGLEALLQAKLQQYSSLKTLCIAEAKLSLSAIMVVAVGAIGLFILLLSSWLLINLLIGTGLFYWINSLVAASFVLLLINGISFFLLFRYLAVIYGHIGFAKTVSSLSKE